MPDFLPQRNISIAFAQNGIKNDIPDEDASPGQATLNYGFPDETFRPPEAGGISPDGADFNGAFNDLYQHARFLNSGGSYPFNSEYALKIGGYPLGSIVSSYDKSMLFLNKLNGNTEDPNFGGKNWIEIVPEATRIATLEQALEGINNGTIITPYLLAQVLNARPSIIAGTIVSWPSGSVPDGYVICDGSVLNRFEYAGLFSSIGEVWGGGDGVSTFAIPDLRGVFVRGNDNGRGIDPGRSLSTLQMSQNASHSHSANITTDGAHGHTIDSHNFRISGGGGGAGICATDYGSPPSRISATFGGGHTHSINIIAQGGNESRGTNVSLNFIIKY